MRAAVLAFAVSLAIVGCSRKSAPTIAPEPDADPRPKAPMSLEERDAVTGAVVWHDGGTFTMGDRDEGPPHEVTLAPYFLDRDEVTVAAYAACVRVGACTPAAAHLPSSAAPVFGDRLAAYDAACNRSRDDRARHPVNCVSWNQAHAFCAWAGKRLPSEAEWESAAGGARHASYPWGPVEFDDDMQPGFVNACGRECPFGYKGDANEDAFPTTAPVGSFPSGASPTGVNDLAGNVWEWVDDRYCAYDGKTPCRSEHVMRGGAWDDPLTTPANPKRRFTRTKRTYPDVPDGVPVDDWVFPSLGFRCARSAR